MQENNNIDLNNSEDVLISGFNGNTSLSMLDGSDNLGEPNRSNVNNIPNGYIVSTISNIPNSSSMVAVNSIVSINHHTSKNINQINEADDISNTTESNAKDEALINKHKNDKDKLVNLLFYCIVIGLTILIIRHSFSVDKIKNTFNAVKPNFPSLPTPSKNKMIETKDNTSNSIQKNTATNIANAGVTTVEIEGTSNSKQEAKTALWQRPDELLASTEDRRKQLFSGLGISKGEYVVACISINCGNCEQIAKELNKKANLDKIIAITNAPLAETQAWTARLGLKYRVEAISESSFDDSGVVILPTLIRVRDGKAVGASETANLLK